MSRHLFVKYFLFNIENLVLRDRSVPSVAGLSVKIMSCYGGVRCRVSGNITKEAETLRFTKIARMPRALHGDESLNPLSPETVSQFVIPAKSRKAGREPRSKKSMIIPNFHWIPLLLRSGW